MVDHRGGREISGNATMLILGSETKHFFAERDLGLTLIIHGLVVDADSGWQGTDGCWRLGLGELVGVVG